MEAGQDDIKRSLVAYAIENALLDMGKPEYEEVVARLEKYNCHVSDCYNHPEYLKKILREIYGNAFEVILQKIEDSLGEFARQESYEKFLICLKD